MLMLLVLIATSVAPAAKPEAAVTPTAATAAADASPAPAAAPAIDTFEQARDLCDSLRGEDRAAAARRPVRALVASKAFAFGRYRKADQELELDGDRPLRTAGDTLFLDIAGIDEVAFRASPEDVQEWKKAKEAGDATLEVTFRPTGDGCTGNKHARHFRLAGRAESWRISARGKQVAEADEEGKPVVHSDTHGAKVTRVAFEGEAPSEDEGRTRLTGAQAALDACVKAAPKAGSVVLAFSAKGGAVREVQVMVDGLRDETLTQCLAKAVAGTPLEGSGKGMATIAVE